LRELPLPLQLLCLVVTLVIIVLALFGDTAEAAAIEDGPAGRVAPDVALLVDFVLIFVVGEAFFAVAEGVGDAANIGAVVACGGICSSRSHVRAWRGFVGVKVGILVAVES